MKKLLATALAALLMTAGCVSVAPLPTPTNQPTSTPGQPPTPTATLAPPTATPSPAPSVSAGPGGTPPTSPPQTPRASVDPTLAAQIDAVTATVPAVRELRATADVPYEFISRDQFRNDLLELVDEDVPVEVRAAEERLLKHLGLLPADADMEALMVELYGAQVAAYYRPDNGRFYIIERDQPFGPSDKIVVAHEYTHALQDQHFDLEAKQIKDPFEGDAALGQLAMIEGDATLTSQLWASENLTPEEFFELLTEALGGLDQDPLEGMPLILRRQLEFPYVEGSLFVNGLYDQGGYDAVNEAIQAPPASTEQILHPEKYAAGEAPVAIPLVDFSASLGAGWSRVYEQTVGELGIQIFAGGGEEPEVSIPGLPADWPHAEVAAGWGGDRLHMYEGPNDTWLIDWQTAWDTQQDADEFSARMIELVPTFQGHVIVEPGSQPDSIHFLLANDVETMDLVQPPR